MAGASYVQSSFIGGLVSKWTQGRYHDQHYRTWLETCVNGFPVETESWTRRPGFNFAGTTRGGNPARVIRFDFQAVTAYSVEFTDGYIRFRSGSNITTQDDVQTVTNISNANPAVVTVASAWATGTTVIFRGLGASLPPLQNRQFTITNLSGTTFSLQDAITGANIDGSSFGSVPSGAMVARIQELTTPYFSGTWATLRLVQAEQTAFLLHSLFSPYQLTATKLPFLTSAGIFTLAPSFFQDGPYLDPILGSTITPGATSGVTTLTLGFQPYVATQAYTIGQFVSSGGIGYQSLIDANVGNTPASSPSDWKVVGFGAAINNGNGFVASDIGRLVRLFSEPALWASGTTYGIGALVSYNPSNIPGAATYYQSLTSSNLGNVPGTDAKNWQLLAIGGQVAQINNSTTLTVNALTPALWTWGKITSLSSTGVISGATGTNIGNMTANGGLAAAFDGVTSKVGLSSADINFSTSGYVGKNYTGGPQSISQVIIYPTTNYGFAGPLSGSGPTETPVQLKLFASNSAPTSAENGTLLADSGRIPNALSPVTLVSSNNSSTWNYAWIEIIDWGPSAGSFNAISTAQVIFYSGAGLPGVSVNCEILGPPLIYSGIAIQTWRLGVYSGTTGWPNVGTYAEGRLWLASAGYPNRIDACVANGINGINNGALPGAVNFAPTDQYGNVTAANAIAYTFNSPDANPILWMIPDLQGVLCGTLSGEWIVQAPATGGIGPTNIVARRMTVLGCANIEPRRCEHTIIIVQRYLRKIVEYFADVFSGKFTAPNLTKDAKQLTIGNIQEIAYQQELVPIVWARVNNGLVGTTYKRDTLMTSSGPTINGWHQHSLGSARQIESLVVGSSVSGTLDALTIVSNDPAKNVRFVEVLSPILDEGAPQSAAQYLDAGIVPTSTAIIGISSPNFPYGGLQLNGLWPLNGYTVTAWLGGLDCGDYTVSNGSISIPYGDGISGGAGAFPASSGANRGDQGLFTGAFVASGVTSNGVTMWTGTMPMLVGFTYTSQGRIVRPNAPAESGARSGPGLAKKRRSQWIMAQLEGSQGISWGNRFDATLQKMRFTHDNGNAYTIDQQFTGIIRDNPQDDYNFDSMLAWQVTRPYICNMQAIGAALETQDI